MRIRLALVGVPRRLAPWNHARAPPRQLVDWLQDELRNVVRRPRGAAAARGIPAVFVVVELEKRKTVVGRASRAIEAA
jgi:hypothetical protein